MLFIAVMRTTLDNFYNITINAVNNTILIIDTPTPIIR